MIDTATDAAIPAPITPTSASGVHQDRVLYENWVNGEAEAFAITAKHRFLDAILAGHSPDDIEVVIRVDHHEYEDDIAPYSGWTVDALATECRTRGLPVSGRKDELIERLETSDAEAVNNPEE